MISFTTIIKKYGQNADKTSWTFIEIPEKFSRKLNTENRKAFQVKGQLDNYAIKAKTIFPLRDGGFLMPLNKSDRKQLGKTVNAKLEVRLQRDRVTYSINKDLVDCLLNEPSASTFFYSLAKSHQHYFSKWIDAAKTVSTKTKRIVQILEALALQYDFPKMRQMYKNNN